MSEHWSHATPSRFAILRGRVNVFCADRLNRSGGACLPQHPKNAPYACISGRDKTTVCSGVELSRRLTGGASAQTPTQGALTVGGGGTAAQRSACGYITHQPAPFLLVRTSAFGRASRPLGFHPLVRSRFGATTSMFCCCLV